MARASFLSHNKDNCIGFTKRCSDERLSTHHGASFYPLLGNFHLQIAYRKVKNSRIGVNKLVGKVLVNSLCHAVYLLQSLKVSLLFDQHNHRSTCCVEVVHLDK